jgi:isoquinoline 1-oxidoreductase subunit alpha
MTELTVNGERVRVDAERDTPLLWVIRETLGPTGTKFGCGMALCGACTVHLDGSPVRSCVTQLHEAAGAAITTIEGLADARGRALKEAWVAENVPQCGYCQAGQIMSAAALLKAVPSPDDEDINAVMSANLCRCGTYPRIRRAIHRAARDLGGGGETR